MPDLHALLGPSSAHMWITCPLSARLGEGIEDKGSEYAQEGTLAHRIGELLLRKRWEGADITADLEAAQRYKRTPTVDVIYYPRKDNAECYDVADQLTAVLESITTPELYQFLQYR